MARKDLSIRDIASCLGITEKAVRNKVNGITAFTFPEVCKIRNTLFPAMELEYLFDQTQSSA